MDFTKREIHDYAIYKLRGNPFPASPVPEESPKIFADQEKALALVKGSVTDSIYSEEKRPVHIIVVGSYGNGKSHTLKVIRTSILDQLYPDNIAVAGYTSTRGWSLLAVYQGFIRDLGIDFFEETKIKILQQVCNSEKISEASRELVNSLLASASTSDLFLDQMPVETRSQARKEIKNFLYGIIPDSDYVSAVANMFSSEEAFRISYKWICGEWVDLFTLRRYDITSRLDSDEKALAAIVNLRRLLESIGFGMVFMCIDELEKITLFPDQTRDNFLDAIRHIMDWNPTGLTLILSCSPEALEAIQRYPPLDRISLRISLDPPDEVNVTKYVEAYVNIYRSEKIDDPLFPFNVDILRQMASLLSERVKLNFRNFLKLCHYAIEEGLNMKKGQIDKEVIDHLEQRTDIYLG